MRRLRDDRKLTWGRRWDHWSPGEDARLLELVRQGAQPTEIARRLEHEFGVPRTRVAVQRRGNSLGVSLAPATLSLTALEHLFSADGGTILRRWVADGYLRALPRTTHQGARWHFRESDVEALVRAHPWLYDWRRMQPGHRLRSIAEVVDRSDPWLTLEEAAEQTRLSVKQLRARVAQEVLPYQRRWHGKAPHGTIVVRATDLARLDRVDATADLRPARARHPGPA